MPLLPKYYRLAEVLRLQIASGHLKPGDRIQSEPALCKQYALSRGTVRQAITLLVDEGLLRREQGRGTFVQTPASKSQHFSLSSFDEEMRRQNRQPTTKLLTNEVIPAPAVVAERLAIALNMPVFHVRRLRQADGQPVAYETRYLARSLCPQLGEEDLSNASLHWLLVEKYQIPLVRLEHVVEVGPISGEVAALLQVAPQSSAFHVDRLTFTTDEAENPIPAVWFQAIYSESNYYIQTHTV